MISEMNLLGIFVPALLVYAVVAFLLMKGISLLLAGVGAYRFVWHRPLFDSAIFILLLGGIVLLINWIKS